MVMKKYSSTPLTYFDKLSYFDMDPYLKKLVSAYICMIGNSQMDMETAQHQVIDYYEVAVGTDRRYPSTRQNINPFINVGLNKTWTFQHLSLVPKIATYYVTVRAHSLSTSVTEVTSNGLKIEYEVQPVIGDIQMQRFDRTFNIKQNRSI